MLDHTARFLRAGGKGFYTIGSAGHESNAAVAAALRPTDPALLHYRSGGFYCARAQQRPGHDPVRDVLAGILALADEPIAGGRHKVFGHHGLAVIPQTSTIASHLPRALGVAFAIGRGKRLGVALDWPHDALAVCTFGDASANHSTAQGAINAACYTAHSGLPVPLLLVCEDNGRGISVPTPQGWIEATFSSRPSLRYAQADGTDPLGGARPHRRARRSRARHRATGAAAPAHGALPRPRRHRRRGRLSLAGAASATTTRSIRSSATARALVASGHRTAAELVDEYLTIREHVRKQAVDMTAERTLVDADEVIAPLSPTTADRRRRHGLAPARSRATRRRAVRSHAARGGGRR